MAEKEERWREALERKNEKISELKKEREAAEQDKLEAVSSQSEPEFRR